MACKAHNRHGIVSNLHAIICVAPRLTSSLAAERAFGIMRHAEDSYRMNMTAENFEIEVFCKINGELLEDIAAAYAVKHVYKPGAASGAATTTRSTTSGAE